jgi:hypothetical protein
MSNESIDANRYTPVSRLLQRNNVIFAVCVAKLSNQLLNIIVMSGLGEGVTPPRAVRLLLLTLGSGDPPWHYTAPWCRFGEGTPVTSSWFRSSFRRGGPPPVRSLVKSWANCDESISLGSVIQEPPYRWGMRGHLTEPSPKGHFQGATHSDGASRKPH